MTLRLLDQRRALPLFVAAFFLLALAALRGPAAHAQEATSPPDDNAVIDQIAAVVGNEIILQSEVENLAMSIAQQSGASYDDQLLRNALGQLIDQAVLASKAREDTTITVSETQLESQLDARIQQLARRVGGEERLEDIYGKSILQLKEEFRPRIREQLLAQQFRGRRMQKIDITPSEVRAWFEQIPQDSLPRLPTTVQLSHIVRYPKPSEEARQQAREIIAAIRDSIVNEGASFEAMARQFSDDPGSAPSGGRISGIRLDDLVPEFAAVAARVPIGDVSQIFYNEQQEGYHIVRVNERAGGTIDFNHILIQVSDLSIDPQPTIDYLSAVRDTLLRTDVPFGLMAKRHSEEDASAERAGQVVDPQSGTRDLVLDALGSSWRSTLDTMKVDEISKPTQVQLLNGQQAYHILKLEEHTPAHRVSFSQDYVRIKQFALQQKQARVMRRWLDELRKETYVDVRINFGRIASTR